MPSLFIAQSSKDTANGPNSDSQVISDEPDRGKSSFTQGFFEDEAYIAPAKSDEKTDAFLQSLYSEAQNSYYDLLRYRFLLLRSTLKCTPPAAVIASLDDSHPISLPRKNAAARKEWRRLILVVDPQMAQLACMDLESVLGVLQILARGLSDNVRSGDAPGIRRLGAWAWSLLGKCREIGELSTEEVGEIRDIGKRAAKILEKVREAEDVEVEAEEDADEDSNVEENGQDEHEEPIISDPEQKVDAPEMVMPDDPNQPDELAAAKERLQARLQDNIQNSIPDDTSDDTELVTQTRAMLDMIITVVGEFFGQRDLLEAREVWTGPQAL